MSLLLAPLFICLAFNVWHKPVASEKIVARSPSSADVFLYTPAIIEGFAGLVAVGPADNAARHYATMMISGDDIFIVSRSGDMDAKNSHDGNMVTFHRVKDFRHLVY